ncbi:MAG: hypothetical protein LC740_15270 [Actinobacteria bacterium]|nr:hypothetical protein [Actinomycetota bacterium]
MPLCSSTTRAVCSSHAGLLQLIGDAGERIPLIDDDRYGLTPAVERHADEQVDPVHGDEEHQRHERQTPGRGLTSATPPLRPRTGSLFRRRVGRPYGL